MSGVTNIVFPRVPGILKTALSARPFSWLHPLDWGYGECDLQTVMGLPIMFPGYDKVSGKQRISVQTCQSNLIESQKPTGSSTFLIMLLFYVPSFKFFSLPSHLFPLYLQ